MEQNSEDKKTARMRNNRYKEQANRLRRSGDYIRPADVKNVENKIEKKKRQTRQGGKTASRTSGKTAGRNACPYVKRCGGCQYSSFPYEEQLAMKQKEMKKLLSVYAKVEPIIGMEDPYHYRHKVNAAFGYEKGTVISGVYEENSHKIVSIDRCLIEHKLADEIIVSIRSLLKDFKIKTYDERTDMGLLRHVMVRVSHATGQIMVILVLRSPILPSKNNFVKALLKRHPEITTIVLNVNDKRTTMVLGKRDIVLYGKGYIEDELCGVTFRLSPQSFYQINPVQTNLLYEKAMEFAHLTGKETVIDAYCGIGTIGLVAAANGAKSVLGIELNPEAVKDARENAKRNAAKNVRFIEADAGQYMVRMAAEGQKVDVVFMDPPRSGSDEAFLSSICRLAPKKIIYVSCGPDTLARDLKYLTKHGYQVKKIQPVDMFPMTEHVETVVLLSQRKADDYVEVELELDELDLTSAESKATYKEIQEYVLKEHGLKVSNLYISQVKRKCGIEVGENYNLPKSEGARGPVDLCSARTGAAAETARQPQCPEEKEKAIRDALEHFGMI